MVIKYEVKNKLYTLKRLTFSKYSIISLFFGFFSIIIYYNLSFFFSFTLDSQYFFFSTNSQVTASLFGLTLTAFAFVNSRLKAAKENDSLVEAIDEIRKNFFFDLAAIALIVLISIILNNISVLKSNTAEFNFLFEFFKVLSFSFFISSIISILLFGIGLFNPKLVRNMIELQMNHAEIAFNNQHKPEEPTYTIEDFIKTYNRFVSNIDLALNEFFLINEKNLYSAKNISDILQQSICDKVELLSTIDLRFHNYKEDFMEIRKYRNGILHGFGVSTHDNMVSTEAYLKLKTLNEILEHDLEILKIKQ